MSTELGSSHITPVGGNVFLDLGFPPDEAKALKAESDRIISEKLALRSQLASEISSWIATNTLKDAEAASALGVTRQQVTDVLSGSHDGISIDLLVRMVLRMGKSVRISVS